MLPACECSQLSNTVVFERPRDEAFVRKWQLACEGDIAHVVVMPNVGIDKLEEFVGVGHETGGYVWCFSNMGKAWKASKWSCLTSASTRWRSSWGWVAVYEQAAMLVCLRPGARCGRAVGQR